jgi:hypothetical protein
VTHIEDNNFREFKKSASINVLKDGPLKFGDRLPSKFEISYLLKKLPNSSLEKLNHKVMNSYQSQLIACEAKKSGINPI